MREIMENNNYNGARLVDVAEIGDYVVYMNCNWRILNKDFYQGEVIIISDNIQNEYIPRKNGYTNSKNSILEFCEIDLQNKRVDAFLLGINYYDPAYSIGYKLAPTLEQLNQALGKKWISETGGFSKKKDMISWKKERYIRYENENTDGLINIGKAYWVADYWGNAFGYEYVWSVDNNGDVDGKCYRDTCGLRPIVYLNPDIKVSGIEQKDGALKWKLNPIDFSQVDFG